MSVLAIRDLHASIRAAAVGAQAVVGPAGGDRFEILRGVDLEVRSGEVHALMGPNGSGKSTLAHVLMGHGDYEVTHGSITIDGVELVGLPTWQRARHGLFVSMQYPVEIPGVTVGDLLAAAMRDRGFGAAERPRVESGLEEHGDPQRARPEFGSATIKEEATRLVVPDELLGRGVNAEFSGGEQKRMETLQLAVLTPTFAVLDEIDSGLDVDALRDVSRRIEAMTSENHLGVLAITHYSRLLTELRPDRVHVFLGGRIVVSGGPELADELEETGYEGLAGKLGVDELAVAPPSIPDPFSEPGF